MPSKKELEDQVDSVLSISWDVRNGTVIPTSDDVKLVNGAVKVDAVFLYADLAATSLLTRLCPWETTAKVIRAYLDTAVRIIRSYDGEIRSFDGDRVMGVFMGDRMNSRSTLAAREIFYTVENIIGPKSVKQFQSFQTNSIKLKNCVGIDYGEARAVRAGIRSSNDLIWIGKSPSFAAKLSDLRTYANCVYISKRVYDRISEDSKIVDGKNIWTARNFRELSPCAK